MITYQYAKSDDGFVKNITDVSDEYRKIHQFTCFGCGTRMSAVLGQKRENHFRHFNDCNCSNETYLHHLGKDLFVELFESAKSQNKRLLVDFIQKKVCVNQSCPLGRDHCFDNDGVYKEFELYPHFTNYVVEVFDHDTGLKPDVLLTNDNGEKLYIEIFVNHESSDEKIASKVPIVEISISEEDDLKCLKPECIGDDLKIDHTFTYCYNIPNSQVLAEKPICLKHLDFARQCFLDHFRYYQQNEQSIELVYPCAKKCESQNCPHLKQGRCVKPSGFDRFDLTGKFDTFIKEEYPESFSQDLILTNGKKASIRFKFGLRLLDSPISNDKEKTVQYAVDPDSGTIPWNECSVIQEGLKVRFLNFEKKNILDCNREFYRGIVLHKNGRCLPLQTGRIADVRKQLIEQLQDLSEYVLIPVSILELKLGFPSNKDIFKAVVSVFKLKKYNVRNCFLCRYGAENDSLWNENSKTIFCKTFRFTCSSGQAVSCDRYRIKYEAAQENLSNEILKKILFECLETYRIK